MLFIYHTVFISSNISQYFWLMSMQFVQSNIEYKLKKLFMRNNYVQYWGKKWSSPTNYYKSPFSYNLYTEKCRFACKKDNKTKLSSFMNKIYPILILSVTRTNNISSCFRYKQFSLPYSKELLVAPSFRVIGSFSQ